MEEIKIKCHLGNGIILPEDGASLETYKKFQRKIAQRVNAYNYPKVEITIRVHDPRQEWIDLWYDRAMKDPYIVIRHCKDVTFICSTLYECEADAVCAAPRHGDKYNKRTGIAVAYAKLSGQKIPDYI